MQDRFYADSRDVWKWICALKSAKGHERILYVAMYRPDDQLTHKKRFTASDEIETHVVQFFDEELSKLRMTSPLWRIEGLDSRVESVKTLYEGSGKEAYFAKICQRLKNRPAKAPYVVLLDPDTGIEPEKSKARNEHLGCDSIASVWRELQPGDVLLVVQFHRFQKNFASYCSKLQHVLNASVEMLEHPAVRNVRILRAIK